MAADNTYDLLYQLTENLPTNERIVISSCPLGVKVKRELIDGKTLKSSAHLFGRLELESSVIPVDQLLARQLWQMATEIR